MSNFEACHQGWPCSLLTVACAFQQWLLPFSAVQQCLSAVPFSSAFQQCRSAVRLSAYLRVEGTEGLIEKKQLGIASEGSGQSHPLPLPPRQLGGLVVSIPRHLYHLQQRFHPAQYGTLYVLLY